MQPRDQKTVEEIRAMPPAELLDWIKRPSLPEPTRCPPMPSVKTPKPNLQDQIAVLNRRLVDYERRDTEQSILLKGAIQKGGELLGKVKGLENERDAYKGILQQISDQDCGDIEPHVLAYAILNP